MSADPENPQINARIYDFCVKAFRTTKKLLKLNIKLHQDDASDNDTVQQGNIFLFNHFARFETFIPQYLIKEATGAPQCVIIAGLAVSGSPAGRVFRRGRTFQAISVLDRCRPQ